MRVNSWICGGVGFVLALGLFWPATSAGQEPTVQEAQGGQALRVFFDCSGPFCNEDFYRREVPFVNYTRDRVDAQVHLLITSEATGAGGRRFTLDFIGREDFEGIDDRLETVTRANLAREQVQTQVARAVKLGLMRYIARTPFADRVDVSYQAPAEAEAAVAQPEDDPWNFWVFRVRLNGGLDVQERTDFFRLSGGLSANRITEDLKLQFSVNGSYSESNFEISDETTITSIFRNYGGSGLVVFSLGEHWSAGTRFFASHSTFSNEDLNLRIGPAIEYDLFPYSESTRRQLRFLYSIGLSYFKYIEETIFLKMEETLPEHRLSISLDVQQPWGSSFAAVEAVQYLNDLGKNRLNFFGGVDLRLFKGLALNLFGSASRVRDQLNLPAGEATEEEILLRQRELQTGFEYSLNVGFSYTFGSIFSNVVNPRFGGSGRSFFFF